MTREELLAQINEEDFLIRIRPYANSEGEWDGELDITLMSQTSNPLSEEDYFQVMHLCKMISASVPLMETEESIRELANSYVENVIDNETIYDVELDDEVEKTYDGNVVHLNFDTATKGSS